MKTNLVVDQKSDSKWKKGLILFVIYFFSDIIIRNIVLLPQLLKGIDSGVDPQLLITTLYIPWYANLIQMLIFIFFLSFSYKLKIYLFSFARFTKKQYLQVAIITASTIVLSFFVKVGIRFLSPGFETVNQNDLNGLFENSTVITIFIMLVIIAPITEEFLFRGLIMNVIFNKFPKIGLFTSVLLFTLIHRPTDLFSFSIYLILSTGLSLVYFKTKRLEASIFLHFINNLL
ncbi:CPBP family intramembrane metalloprotease, partial [Listeria monocytogenes]|nr:CPBP family intramembrane metalloprotease [Listeria monocytogenes]